MTKTRFFFLALFAICSMVTMAQSQKVSGVVADRDGVPVIGATVVEKGTKNATVTDLEGHFTLQVGQGAMISVSYIGHKSQDIKPTNAPMHITLEEEANGLVMVHRAEKTSLDPWLLSMVIS